ncbi:restriction endonuclease [Wenyingzhuangia sp. 2_MG-2023]|uniref:nSTAND3 domain-containing NTPase n=1 Tax=Wenyingzhuangia sp. 2_MG-2023 TaxID=3062639 RepID=UPI0026E25AC8|nr:restriction endonuclease [Wenyingzhuangia sp. 2_MG-2023]MDO6736252.1 restriction endonuclease [Wenyingzhuangia sp. 2_MG-2023]
MSDYDFSTLNSNDFEKLVCDLLNESSSLEGSVPFRSFKPGKDGGIDLLHSSDKNEKEIVVQIKHYYKSSFATLRRDLEKNEVSKVHTLNPKKYIFVTSLELSFENKRIIKNIFSPYIKNISDIYGKDDLNDILRKNKHIEENHFKLWLSSAVAIQKIQQYKFIGRKNEFQENQIKQKLRLFVITREHYKAINILNENNFLIITGEPGVGKTTLSEILIYRYLSKKYQLTVIYDDIREIELELKDDESKQIFYFDDFLGHTQAEIQKSKSAETYLLKIISRIENSKNKLLILNTRKFILNSFLDESERFKNFNPLRAEAKIELHTYSYGAKRRMLDNHINEFELSSQKKEVLKTLAHLICTHSNFSPRHLEFFTNKHYIGELDTSSFHSFITENLANPKRIWEHAYNKQISDKERFLLYSLYSLGSKASKKSLELAFDSRITYEVRENNFFKPTNPFNDSLRILNEGFIISYSYNNYIEFNFINPSLEDFLKYYIENNNYELTRILSSSIYIEQWFVFYKPFEKKNIEKKLINIFISKFSKNKISEVEKYKAILFLASYAPDEINVILKILKSIYQWDFISGNVILQSYSLQFLKNSIREKKLLSIICKLDYEYFLRIILNCKSIGEVSNYIHLFQNNLNLNFKEKFNFNSLTSSKYSYLIKEIYLSCKFLLKNEIEFQYNYLLKSNTYVDEHLDVIDRIENYISFFNNYMFEDLNIKYDILLTPNWNDIALQNNLNSLSLKKESNSIDEDLTPEYFDFGYEYNYDQDYDYDLEEKTNDSSYLIRLNDNPNDLPF